MNHDTIIMLPSGNETTVEAALADLQRVSEYLAGVDNDNAQGFASDVEKARALIVYLANTDLRSMAWRYVVILGGRDSPLGLKYDRILRDMEEEYTERSAWLAVIRELEDLTLF